MKSSGSSHERHSLAFAASGISCDVLTVRGNALKTSSNEVVNEMVSRAQQSSYWTMV